MNKRCGRVVSRVGGLVSAVLLLGTLVLASVASMARAAGVEHDRSGVAGDTGSARAMLKATPTPLPPGVGNATFSISTSQQRIDPGDSVEISVLISVDSPIRGAQCGLTFDPGLLEVSEVLEGAFLKDWAQANDGQTLILPQPQIDNAKGVVSPMGISIMGGAEGGVSGEGVLLTFRATAKSGASGVSPLALIDVFVADRDARVLAEASTKVEVGSLQVGESGQAKPSATPRASKTATPTEQTEEPKELPWAILVPAAVAVVVVVLVLVVRRRK